MTQINVKTEVEYKGNNQSTLTEKSKLNNYTSNKWGSFKCWESLGRQIIKGEKSTSINHYKKMIDEEKLGRDGKPKKYTIKKTYHLFNESQTQQK